MPEAEDTSFAAILEVEPTEAEATPEVQTEEVTPATEGGEPESETLGILKDEEAPEEEDEKPDLDIDPDLEKHPVLKAKWEAYKAQKEKGINKFIQSHTEKLKPLEEYRAEAEPVMEFARALQDPEQVDAAVEQLLDTLSKRYGRQFGSPKVQDEQPDEPISKYGLEFPSDDKVVDVVLSQVKSLLEPITKKYETESQTQAIQTKAQAAVTTLKTEFEVSSEPWITPDLVAAAIRKYPNLEPAEAFAAMYVKEIARYTAKHSAGRKQEVRNLPTGLSGGKSRADLQYGAGMEDIFMSEATL